MSMQKHNNFHIQINSDIPERATYISRKTYNPQDSTTNTKPLLHD